MLSTLETKSIVEMYQSGLSVKQISDKIGIGSSRVNQVLIASNIPRRDHSSASRLLHETKFGKHACNVLTNLTPEQEILRIAGVMLYWGEGTKDGNSVVFSNSDPDMVSYFLRFLREICGVSDQRLRLLLHIYDDQNEAELKKYWSDCTKIPISQFSKTYCHAHSGGSYKKISMFGTVSLRYSDKNLLKVIVGWIKKFKMPA
ncbi:MAG: hypothetical protein WCO23_03755 [bacterium]